MNILKWAGNFFVKPGEAFRQAGKGRLKHAFTYLLVLLSINTVLSAAVYTVFGFPAGIFAQGVAIVFITGLVGSLATGLWLFLWILLLGGRGLKKSLMVVFYGSTPYLLVGWLTTMPETVFPDTVFLKLGLLIWSFLLYGIGMREIIGLNPMRAWAASALGIIVGFVILFLLSFFVLYSVIPMIFSLAA